MAKILLVEDDQSLREIYSIRLTAEGYEIIAAGDGEEALAIAVREKPDLIVSDVMMPKISGFDMLDILHSTQETKDIKVIMMTALSSDDQRKRGESLGADRYLVKSQVGIEDVVNAVHEVMKDVADDATATTESAQPATTTEATAEVTPEDEVILENIPEPSMQPESATESTPFAASADPASGLTFGSTESAELEITTMNADVPQPPVIEPVPTVAEPAAQPAAMAPQPAATTAQSTPVATQPSVPAQPATPQPAPVPVFSSSSSNPEGTI